MWVFKVKMAILKVLVAVFVTGKRVIHFTLRETAHGKEVKLHFKRILNAVKIEPSDLLKLHTLSYKKPSAMLLLPFF